MSKEFVLDASVTLNWKFLDEVSEYSSGVAKALSHYSAVVPFIWALEIPNVLLVSERRKRITQIETEVFLKELSSLPITIVPSRPEILSLDLVRTARKHSLSIYDATYLDLAMRKKLPLATKDSKMREVMKEIGIELFEV